METKKKTENPLVSNYRLASIYHSELSDYVEHIDTEDMHIY